MALTKISELTAAGALDGTEMIPVVQSSTTKRATPAQIRTYIAALIAANNLSDLASASTARTNLGLGSIATQAASSVAITGGSITGITDLAVADGGSGASTAAGARTNFGLDAGGAGDIWVEKAGDTLTGQLSINTGALAFSSLSGDDPVFRMIAPEDSGTRMMFDAYGAGIMGNFIIRRARTSAGTPTAVQSTDGLGQITFWGYGATGFSTSGRAALRGLASENWTDSAQGTRFVVQTTANGGTSTAEKFGVEQDGALTMGSANTVIDSNRLFRLRSYTVATLPAAGTAGRKAYVTDALAPTYLATLVGGGAVVTEAFDNGTNWVGT